MIHRYCKIRTEDTSSTLSFDTVGNLIDVLTAHKDEIGGDIGDFISDLIEWYEEVQW